MSDPKTAWYARNRERALARARTWREENSAKAKAARIAWRAAHPEYAKEASWRRRGIKAATKAAYDALLAQQKGCCAICGVEPKKSLVWNHDRVSGQPRGLLCHSCNFRLALLDIIFSKPDWWLRCEAYLERYS